MTNIKRLLFDEDGQPADLFYVAAYVVLVHVFFYKFLIPGQLIFGTDTMSQSYPIQVMGMREILKQGYLMQWNPYIFSGMPFLASFSFHILYPGSWIFFFMPLKFAMGYLYVMHFVLMAVFTYYMMKEFGVSRHAAFVGGLVCVFNAHLISLVYPGHGGKIITVTFLPLALMLTARAFKSKPFYNMALVGLLVGLMFYGGHPQILFYCGIALSLLFVFLAATGYRENGMAGTLKLFGYFAASFAVGALLYAAILLPAMQYRSYTHRAGGMTGASSYKFATSFSQPPEDMLYIPLRNPFGWGKDYGPKTPTTEDIFYRGRIGLRLSIDYMSVFGMVLAIIGAVFVRNRYSWYFTALALLSMSLALGGFNPLYEYVYRYIPGFSLFRVPYAIMILLPLCWGALSAYGMQHLMDRGGKAGDRGLGRFVYAGAVFTLAVLCVAAYWRLESSDVMEGLVRMQWVREMLWGYYGDIDERFSYFLRNVFVFVALMSASLAVIAAYMKGRLRRTHLIVFAVVFILADLWPMDWEFIKTVPASSVEDTYFNKSPEIEMMLEDKDEPFRVFSMVTNNELLYYGLESMTGYHAVLLAYYEKALGRLDMAGPMLDLLNAKYLMLPKKPENDFKRYPDTTARGILADKYELLDDEDMYFYKRRRVLPRAYLVNKLWVAGSLDQALGVVSDRRFDPSSTAVLVEQPEQGTSIDQSADLSGQKVEVSRNGTDRLSFRVSAPADSFMVISEVWYPGWEARLDGKPARIYRTDYLLRGVAVPKGEHVIEMEFDPPLFKLGAALSLITLAALAWLIVREHAARRHAPGPVKGE